MQPVVTVLTPTYNRFESLKRLYISLREQTDQNFIWIVIDDGSNDGTTQLLNEWIKIADFEIRYYKKPNGGKHTALNFSYQYINTPLTFIVDSDDWLTPGAISTIEKDFSIYGSDPELCGLSYLLGKPNSGILSSSCVPKDGMKESYCECRINRNISGDMAEVWFTDILKRYPFPIFEGEKFLGEDLIWIKMSKQYNMRFFNEIIRVSDYLPDGLTSNRRKYNILSPNGCVARAETFLNADIRFKYKIKAMLQYLIYGKFAGKTFSSSYKSTKFKLLCRVCLIPSFVIYSIWRHYLG